MSQPVNRKFYTDPQFHAPQVVVAGFAVSFGTSTASGANALTPTTALPSAIGKTRVRKVRMVTTTIPHASNAGLKATFLNGTDAFAEVVLTTSTANQQLDGVITSEANAILADKTKIAVALAGTSTASGVVLGAYDILFEIESVVP